MKATAGVRLLATARDRFRGVGRDLTQAIRLGPVWQGLVGTSLLVVGSLSPAYLPQASPFWGSMRALGLDSWWAKAFATGLVIAAVFLLIRSWLALRPTVYVDVKHWAVLYWWILPLLFAPPIFSHDAYSYAAHGWLLHNGFNPYEASPSVLPGTFADQVSWFWRYTPSPYGPLSMQISHGLVLLAGLNPYYSAVLMRLPALVGVFLIVHFLPRIAHELAVPAADVAWFSTINPLLVIDFVGGAHNDALMMGLLIWGLYLAYRHRFLAALVLVGLASSIKQPAILGAYAVAVIHSGWASWQPRDVVRFLPRALFAFAVSGGVFVAVSFATGLGFGWVDAVGVPGMIVTLAPFSIVAFGVQAVLNHFALDPTGTMAMVVARTISLALCAVIIAWLAFTRSRTEPMRFLSWSYLAFAVFGPALQTWYLLWGGLLLPLTRPSPRVWRVAAVVTAVLLVYGAGNLAWRNDAVALALAALAAAVIWLVRRLQDRKEHRRHAEADR